MKHRTTSVVTLVLVALVVVEQFLGHHETVFPWHSIPGFQALLGFGSCVLVVLGAKAIGHAFLQRPDRENDRGR